MVLVGFRFKFGRIIWVSARPYSCFTNADRVNIQFMTQIVAVVSFGTWLTLHAALLDMSWVYSTGFMS